MPSKNDIGQDLKEFFSHNPWSEFGSIEVHDGKDRNTVVNPWGDESLEIIFPEKKRLGNLLFQLSISYSCQKAFPQYFTVPINFSK